MQHGLIIGERTFPSQGDKLPCEIYSILRFLVERAKIGKTSVQYAVNVFNEDVESGDVKGVFSTHVTFVCVDEEGNKADIKAG